MGLQSVWFDFGGDLMRHDEPDEASMNKFLDGVAFALECLDISDVQQLDTLEEARAWVASCPPEHEVSDV